MLHAPGAEMSHHSVEALAADRQRLAYTLQPVPKRAALGAGPERDQPTRNRITLLMNLTGKIAAGPFMELGERVNLIIFIEERFQLVFEQRQPRRRGRHSDQPGLDLGILHLNPRRLVVPWREGDDLVPIVGPLVAQVCHQRITTRGLLDQHAIGFYFSISASAVFLS